MKELTKDQSYLMGKFNPSTHPDFVVMNTTHTSGRGMYLRKDAYEAFKEMFTAAKNDGIDLRIISATRPFSHQKNIWEGKWNGSRKVDGKNLAKTFPWGSDRAKKILEYSSMPGTSRHHWGTDIDLNKLQNSYFESGYGKNVYLWLKDNAPRFGFRQPYTAKDSNRPNGYNEEKWHWSYVPVSVPLTRQYAQLLQNGSIEGFDGSEFAKEIDMVKNYVLGVAPDCK